jgi:hypothetical protein
MVIDNATRDKQIIKTLRLINFVDFSLDANHSSIFKHYQDLKWDNTKTIDDIEDIKKHILYAILNYLYTGEWGFDSKTRAAQWLKLTVDSRKAFGLAVFKEKVKNTEIQPTDEIFSTQINIIKEEIELIEYLSSTWKQIFEVHNEYIKSLQKNPIESIIIYEAPPFPKEGNLNYILLDTPTGPYSNAINHAFTEGDSISDKLINKRALFFDLLMLPIPLSSTIRRDWSTKDKFKIDGKQLPVVLFEMNLVYYLNMLSDKGIDPSTDIKIAIGTPHLTALGIYNHYCEHDLKINTIDFKNIKTSLIDTNKLVNKLELMDYVVPLFKSCFVNASNNPDGELLKHALGNEKKKIVS